NLKLLINFIWKFMGTVRFGNDHVATILGFEVAFRRNAYFVRNLEGVDLLKGDHSTNLYTINHQEMASASLICLMAHASSTKSWLWYQRLSHLNFDTINDLARFDLVVGLPKFKYHKEHLFPSCEQGKSKRASHPTKPVPSSRQRLHLLHMDLCRPMIIASINGKRYVLVIVDDYSRYTWSPVIIIRTDNGTEFKNQVLKEFFDTVGISHQMSFVQTPQQNGVVERRNRTLVDAAITMLIFSRAPLFLWAEAIATACFTQNRSIIHHRFNKTPYELINGRKLDISFLHVFGALCYPKNNREDTGKLGTKADIGFFIGYSADSCAYRVYNRLDLTYAPSTITTQQPSEGELDLLFEAMYDDYIGGQLSATVRTVPPTQEPQVHTFKSTSGGAQFLGEKLVSWSSKNHSHILQSGSTLKNKTHRCPLPFHKGARGKGISQWRYNLTLVDSKFKTPMLDHQDKYLMKTQVHVSKSSAISDIQALPRRKHYCQIYQVVKHKLRGRLLASFQDHEHEGGDTRSRGGIKDNDS
nr:retrovirus-related Pol polyprotein from transposon TNT 1-94 [Tanacetum cinerariifolium]